MLCGPGVTPYEALQRTPRLQREKTPERAGQPAPPGTHRVLYCKACNLPITSEDERVDVAGASVHRRVNPLGVEYEFGCFANAAGCSYLGGATEEHTWFAGYAWRIALCSGCQSHLGWLFRSPGRAFHGLITGRLRAGDAQRAH